MKAFFINNRDMITNVLGALPATAVAGYQTYEMTQGVGGNGTTIILAMVMALISYATGKK